MNLDVITPGAVEEFLQAVRNSTSSDASPLLGADAVSTALAAEGIDDTPAGRYFVLARLLEKTVWEALGHFRGSAQPTDRAKLTLNDHLALLEEDFQRGNHDLEAWSVVYFQCFGAPAEPVAALHQLSVPYHTVRRRHLRGCVLLARRFIEIELAARNGVSRRRGTLQPTLVGSVAGGDGEALPAPGGIQTTVLPPRTRIPHRPRIAIAAGSALTLLALLVGVLGFVVARDRLPAFGGGLPVPSGIAIAGRVDISPLKPRAGEPVTVTFRVRNNSDGFRVLPMLRAGARGPDACSLGWSARTVDFPLVQSVRLAPGEEYLYRQTRTFNRPGNYFAEPVKADAAHGWGGIGPSPRAWFNVTEPTTGSVVIPTCLVVAQGPAATPAIVTVGDLFTVSLRLRNATNDVVYLQRIVIALREPDARQGAWGQPTVFLPSEHDLTLGPGAEVTYSRSRTATQAGAFTLEPVVQQDDKWTGIWPYPEMRLLVRSASASTRVSPRDTELPEGRQLPPSYSDIAYLPWLGETSPKARRGPL